ncbi:ABC transporter ATP-binding protein [Arthrobacter cupressi]|uniref:Energy-coupling factor transport system ATP-binding protein n=1 Tax=Arthrobacter cupressi TaxID=1045773 RepID=A0A1G8M733_9MICC|nr:ABC transporter ATP-binding protein [Arthrobacter cupressi]NYD79584.1 energy-coupling factor transport system ATP-binding protein [Arthrobacter cupressi]SDI63180.1 energy-coupling factor transport system ATP-binding protein [Arthrobacter cupressi]
MNHGPLLAAHVESFSFHGAQTPALRDVRLSVEAGSLTAVLGGSGSGKSTLARILAAWLPGSHGGELRGRLELGAHGAGARVDFDGGSDDPRIDPAAWAAHVAYVPQDAAAMLSTVRDTVAGELAFGLENLGVPVAEMRRRIAETAELIGLGGLLGRGPATLSGGELRRLAIGCAVIGQPSVLLLDEPFASLDAAGAGTVERLLWRLTADGTAVVVFSSAVDGLSRTATSWTVLGTGGPEGGRQLAAGPPDALLAGDALARSGVVVPGTAPQGPVRNSGHTDAAPVLELKGVRFGYHGPGASERETLRGVELAVRPGEVLAVTGPNGSGKSTLLRQLNGLLRPRAGSVLIQGLPTHGIPTGVLAVDVGLLFQDPRFQLFERTALREVAFGLGTKRRLLRPNPEDARVRERALAALAAVGLEAQSGSHPLELPASSRRLLALATVIAREPAVLALDEPTVGLDRHGLEVLDTAMAEATARGAAVVMVTHDLAYARARAHRLLRLDNGVLAPVE